MSPLLLDGYVRVSRVGDRGGACFISPDVQEERIRAYAKSRGWRVGCVLCELDRSGTDPNRPQLQLALRRVERGESGGIVVARLDRLGRDVLEALTAIRRITAVGGEFASVEDGLDSATDLGRAMMTILLAFAELEHERVRQNWVAAQRRAVARGVHHCAVPPVGYRRAADGRLDPSGDAPLISEAFRRRAAGSTYSEIARLLRDGGIGGSPRSRQWTEKSVRRLLLNPVYLGEARAGAAVNPFAHPALVSRSVWLLAQPGGTIRTPTATASLLAGLIRCSGCCHILVRQRIKSASGATTGYVFRCRRRHTNGICPAPAYVRATEIEAVAAQEYDRLVHSSCLRRTGANLDAAAAKVDRLLLQAKIEESDCSNDLPGPALASAQAKLAVAARHAELHHRRLARRSWQTMSDEEKRTALRALFDAVMVARGPPELLRDRVTMIAAGELPDYFPLRGVTRHLQPFAASKDERSPALSAEGRDAAA